MMMCGFYVCCFFSFSEIGFAETEIETAGRSYEEIWQVFKPGSGTKDSDPNVYVYTPEFAKRFRMPAKWVSTDLKGADAVAFRVVPAYSSCGWGGDASACRTDEVRCEMDIYFDHKRNPLPWDQRYPEIWADRYGSSSHFIPAPFREDRLPKRPNDHFFARYSPFVDPKTGQGLWWDGGYKNEIGYGGIFMSLISYDREIFAGVALVVMAGGCGKPADALWLSSSNDLYQQQKSVAFKWVTLPDTNE